nr:MAG TPA: hypothetical protein [Caudoviricetes sp.]
MRDGFATGRDAAPGFQEKQLTGFYRDRCAVPHRKPGYKCRVRFLRLVGVRHRDRFQGVGNAGRQFVTLRDGLNNLPERGVMP